MQRSKTMRDGERSRVVRWIELQRGVIGEGLQEQIEGIERQDTLRPYQWIYQTVRKNSPVA
jgi:hypothetical protein